MTTDTFIEYHVIDALTKARYSGASKPRSVRLHPNDFANVASRLCARVETGEEVAGGWERVWILLYTPVGAIRVEPDASVEPDSFQLLLHIEETKETA